MARTSRIRRDQETRDQETTTMPKFPDPFRLRKRDLQLAPVTLVELRMRTLVGEVIEKPDWRSKVRNIEILEKWRNEFIKKDAALVRKFWPQKFKLQYENTDLNGDIGPKLWPRDEITASQLDYIFGWLTWLAEVRDGESGTEATHIPGIYQSNDLILPEVTEALKKYISVLESVPDAEKDWHPGTNNKVLDLVHPSLHCFRLGKSFAVESDTGMLRVPTIQEYMQQRPDLKYLYNLGQRKPYSISIQHQWLPTDFAVSLTGEVTNLSYINNLHPDLHKQLYSTINSILSKFVALWERVLSDALSPTQLAIQVDPYKWYKEGDFIEPQFDHFEREYADDPDAAWPAYEEAYEKWDAEKVPFIPDPTPFSAPQNKTHFDLKGKKLQVIVKMANIVLTPEDPKYDGGSWHVEGMENERIVATGLYYYDSVNITESRLSFRTALYDRGDMPYQQNDHMGYLIAYGINGFGLLSQDLGHIVTKQGKCLAFPNAWQHRVSPFKLQDPSKPGHRKILCFFLVDPTESVLSTSVVPPQQYDWYVREMERAPIMQTLPRELRDRIAEELLNEDMGLMTVETAKQERAKLMEERAKFVIAQNEHVYELEFSMCEH